MPLTGSEYGFIGEVLRDDGGPLYLKTHAITDISWNEQTRNFYKEGVAQGLEFRNLDNLFGHVIRTGEIVIANEPLNDPRAGGIPKGHPPLNAFLGLPFFARGRLIGMVGIANRKEGYAEPLVELLRPFVLTCSNIISSLRIDRQRRTSAKMLAESELRGRAILDNAIDAIITIDARGTMESANPATTTLFGYANHELVGANVSTLMPEPDKSAHDGYLSRYLETGEASIIGRGREVVGRRKDGTLINVELSVKEVRLEGRRIFVGVLRDVSQRKTDEERLRKLNQELARRVEELDELDRDNSLMAQLGSYLQTCTNEIEALDMITSYMDRLFPNDGCHFGRVTNGPDVERIGDLSVSEPFFQRSACWALRRGQLHESETGRHALRCNHLGTHRDSALCVPVLTHDGPMGVMTLTWRPENGDDSSAMDRRRRLLSVLSERLSTTLANVRLRVRLEEESIRDPLTRLYNRRYMSEFLERHLRRSRRSRQPLALIMVDIDHFKRLNDVYGHDIGDLALRELSRELEAAVRTDDAACRLGGEEFLLILPGLALDQARVLAEKLRGRIAELGDRAGSRLPAFTASMGIAVFPDHDDTELELLKLVDSALYAAKHAGRNLACVSGEAPPASDI
ncbi:MAG: diguanylate cyclase [Myxococcales bacterium]|nr:diguanylate cyclase [Myxococcales bacterium]